MPVDPGRYRHVVTVRRQVVTEAAGGGSTLTPVVIDDAVWCRIEPKGGTEAAANGRMEARRMVEIETRHRTDIATDCEIVDGATVYRITSIRVPESHGFDGRMFLSCEAVL